LSQHRAKDRDEDAKKGAKMKTKPKSASATLVALAMPILSRGSLIWLGFVIALLLQDSVGY